MQKESFKSFAIYKNPADYPFPRPVYVARLFIDEKPADTVFHSSTLESTRELMLEYMSRNSAFFASYCIPRFENDEPHIVEVWL